MENSTKGIVLAGGAGTRLYPLTKGLSKQLLPIYDKPMIYYPISVLMLAGIQQILIITTSEDLNSYKRLLGDGSQFGVSFEYKIQKEPKGIAEAFMIGEDFIGKGSVALVLGDNLFYGQHFQEKLNKAISQDTGATIFGYYVKDPERFGVVEFDQQGRVLNIDEKPAIPKSNYAVTGLYFYDNKVVDYAKDIKPSERGELEITDINSLYLKNNTLRVELLGRGFTWLDSGTHQSLLEANQFVYSVEQGQGLKVACLEEIAYKSGLINRSQLLTHIESLNNNYGNYLSSLIDT